jgi:hypothetical protein
VARIVSTLIAKSGWRACPRCSRWSLEYGADCDACNTSARQLIQSAMTPAARRLAAEIVARTNADLTADART